MIITLFCLASGSATAAGQAGGDTEKSAAQQLIDAYVPRMMLREQRDPPCDTSGEQYQPTSLNNVVLDTEVVELKDADPADEQTMDIGVSVIDIAGYGEPHHLDLPGDPLGDTCEYARDFAQLRREGLAAAVTYAHLAREAGRPGLAVQYWFFWYFNQFSDLHEGDWEGMQVVFKSSDPRRALAEGPSEIALFQHGGGEKADWTDDKVEKEGTHPVVYAAAGSHSTFYEPAVYVENGRGGSGIGCEDTSPPLRRLELRPIRVPTDPDPEGRFGWLTFEGHWGQRVPGYGEGPIGPASEDRWLAPLTWMEEISSTSPPRLRLPDGSALGPTAATAFCGTVAGVTSFLNRAQGSPWVQIVAPTALLVLSR